MRGHGGHVAVGASLTPGNDEARTFENDQTPANKKKQRQRLPTSHTVRPRVVLLARACTFAFGPLTTLTNAVQDRPRTCSRASCAFASCKLLIGRVCGRRRR